jgi:acyl-CoA reductase-like NAD-dependent aldehyde dehydrogenase
MAADPRNPETDLGPLISVDVAKVVAERIAAAVSDGAVLLQGGERVGALVVNRADDLCRYS